MTLVAFYTELKNVRQQQEIDLSEVANRTKINIKYLEALESGDFSFLPNVYVRLFLRAYSVEVGADPVDALNQLDIHLAKTEAGSSRQETSTADATAAESEDEEYEPSKKTPFQIRSDLIKVILLIAVVLFAVFVIRRIVSEEPEEVPVDAAEENVSLDPAIPAYRFLPL